MVGEISGHELFTHLLQILLVCKTNFETKRGKRGLHNGLVVNFDSEIVISVS